MQRRRGPANKQKSRQKQQQKQQRQSLTALQTPIAAAPAHVSQPLQVTTEQQQQPVIALQLQEEAPAAQSVSAAAPPSVASPSAPLSQPPRRETHRLAHASTQQRSEACAVGAQQQGQLNQLQQLQMELEAQRERLAARSEARQVILSLVAGVAACAAVKCGVLKPHQLQDSNLKGQGRRKGRGDRAADCSASQQLAVSQLLALAALSSILPSSLPAN